MVFSQVNTVVDLAGLLTSDKFQIELSGENLPVNYLVSELKKANGTLFYDGEYGSKFSLSGNENRAVLKAHDGKINGARFDHSQITAYNGSSTVKFENEGRTYTLDVVFNDLPVAGNLPYRSLAEMISTQDLDKGLKYETRDKEKNVSFLMDFLNYYKSQTIGICSVNNTKGFVLYNDGGIEFSLRPLDGIIVSVQSKGILSVVYNNLISLVSPSTASIHGSTLKIPISR